MSTFLNHKVADLWKSGNAMATSGKTKAPPGCHAEKLHSFRRNISMASTRMVPVTSAGERMFTAEKREQTQTTWL